MAIILETYNEDHFSVDEVRRSDISGGGDASLVSTKKDTFFKKQKYLFDDLETE